MFSPNFSLLADFLCQLNIFGKDWLSQKYVNRLSCHHYCSNISVESGTKRTSLFGKCSFITAKWFNSLGCILYQAQYMILLSELSPGHIVLNDSSLPNNSQIVCFLLWYLRFEYQLIIPTSLRVTSLALRKSHCPSANEATLKNMENDSEEKNYTNLNTKS